MSYRDLAVENLETSIIRYLELYSNIPGLIGGKGDESYMKSEEGVFFCAIYGYSTVPLVLQGDIYQEPYLG
jgi:hypothetical protein